MALRPLNYISLCTGGGGLDLALGLANPDARPVLYVEREAYAAAHLVAAMEGGLLAEAPVWSDAETLRCRSWRGLVDGVIGGIPCQPYSLAGERLGEDDERDLWPAARRIVNAARPWFVWIENVPGMLAGSDGAIPGAARIWHDLQSMAFAVEGAIVGAEDVEAPHVRQRIFILGIREMADAVRGVRDGRAGKSRTGSAGRIDAGGAGAFPLFPPGPDAIRQWIELLRFRPDLEPSIRRGADGLAARVHELWMLGNGVVPLAGADAFRACVAAHVRAGRAGADRLVRVTAETGDGEGEESGVPVAGSRRCEERERKEGAAAENQAREAQAGEEVEEDLRR